MKKGKNNDTGVGEIMEKSALASLPLFSSKNIIMLLIDPSGGRIIEGNVGAIDFYGYSLEELKSMYIRDINILPPEEVQAEMNRAKAERRNYFMFRHRKSDGTIANVEVHSEPITVEGKEVLFSVIQDTTEHHRLMNNYVDVLQRYQTLFNHVGDMIFLVELDDLFHPKKIIEVNSKALEVLSYTEEELLNKSVYDLVNPTTLEKFSMIGSELRQNGESAFYTDIIDKYDHSAPFYVSATMMRYDGEDIVVAMARDLSVEFELQMDRDIQENYYRSLFAKSPNNIFVVDENNLIVDYNIAVAKNFNFENRIITGTSIVNELVRLNVEKNKVEKLIEFGWETKSFKEILTGKSDAGHPLYIEVMITPFELPDSSRKSYIMINDITKFVEESNKIDMLSAVFSNNNEGVLITDSKRKVEWVNHSFEKITGYSVEEVIGKSPSFLKSNKHKKKFFDDLWQSVQTKGAWTGEIWNRKKTGEVIPVQLNIFSMEDRLSHHLKYIGIISDIEKLKEQENKILELIYTDPLTQLRNRSFLMNELNNKIHKATVEKSLFSIIYIDLDNFKMINDTMGHSFGDEVLKRFSKYLMETFGSNSLVARIGGDEFTVIIEEWSHEKINILLDNLITRLREPMLIKDKVIRLLFSAGIAQFPTHGVSGEVILKNADIAMYKAKEFSGSVYKYYTEIYSRNMARELYIENLVISGIENEEFYLEYQPIVSRNSEKVVGIEALIRWNTEDNGIISPGEFIPICEKNGTIKDLGRWILDRSIKDLMLLNSALSESLFLAINVSTVQLFDHGLVEAIKNIIESEGIDPSFIELEIRETAYVEDFEMVKDILSEIKALGVKIVIDDFGTGYSSFNQLIHLEVDKLKIDQSFIREIESSERHLNLVSGILSMADNLNLGVVCEGIEYFGQLNTMAHTSWAYGQGFIFSKPKKIGRMIQELNQDNIKLKNLLAT